MWPSCTATNDGEIPGDGGGAAGFTDRHARATSSRSTYHHQEGTPALPPRDQALNATCPPPPRAGLQRIASMDLMPIVDDNHHHHTIDHDEVMRMRTPPQDLVTKFSKHRRKNQQLTIGCLERVRRCHVLHASPPSCHALIIITAALVTAFKLICTKELWSIFSPPSGPPSRTGLGLPPPRPHLRQALRRKAGAAVRITRHAGLRRRRDRFQEGRSECALKSSCARTSVPIRA